MKLLFVCLREVTPLPEAIVQTAQEPLSPRVSWTIPRMGPCHVTGLPRPCNAVVEQLQRRVCDVHNKPILGVPQGSLTDVVQSPRPQ